MKNEEGKTLFLFILHSPFNIQYFLHLPLFIPQSHTVRLEMRQAPERC